MMESYLREEQLEEKNVPTSPEKWARAKAAAKSKFAVYPSAYANGWASKKYKSMGGGWKSVSEEQGVAEGEVKQFPKKHRGDLEDTHSCVKCGGDLQGGTYMGHKVKVCIPCKQVYLPPNTGIDQRGNKVDEQGVAEGFPHDVDHMPGPVIRNADMTTDNVKTKDKAEWDRATNSINARVFDDMSEFRTDSKGETVVGDSAVWAKWDNATQTGWFNTKGRPLKPWPVKEQDVAEAQLDEKCWDGYQQQGTKNKAGRQVPNCVPTESVAEGEPGDLENELNRQEYNDDKIGGRYDPDDFDAMVARLKKLAGAGPMKTVYDPQKRVYRNVPTAVQPKR